MSIPFEVDWGLIDTVLLDMDGTLLDLRFDNWFWLELIPEHYARAHGMSVTEAAAELAPRFHAARGTIAWYCIDHWTRELRLDIAALKRAQHARIGFLQGAKEFLHGLERLQKRRIIVSNAHPETLAIKSACLELGKYVEQSISSHFFNAPKEDPIFWPRLHAQLPFDSARTLFIDDSLPVLEAARGFGIVHLRAVRMPDSGRPAQDTGSFIGVDRVADLLSRNLT